MSSFFSQSGSGLNVSYTLTNGRTMRISWPGGERIIRGSAGRDETGSFTITRRGRFTINYQITFYDNQTQGSVQVSIDGSEALNYQNLTITQVPKEVPCTESTYELGRGSSFSRTPCRDGYSKASKSQYRARSRWTGGATPAGITGAWSGWFDGTYTPPAGTTPTRAISGYRTYWRRDGGGRRWINIDQQTLYYCQADAGCTETVQEDQATYTINRNGSFGNYRNGESAEEEAARLQREADKRAADQRAEAERRAAEAKAKAEAEKAAARAAELAAQATAKTYHDQLLRTFGGSKQIRDIPASNTGYTKYRVITPVQYVRDGSKLVPRVRFESVRELSPEAVSSLVHRGYEVQAVDPNTPLSSSKAYGPSVINHAQAAIDQKQIVGSSEINERRAAIMRAQQNRSGYRRVIR